LVESKVETALIDFDNLDLVEAASKVKALSQSDQYSYVITPNIDHVARLCEPEASASLLPIYRSADLCLCDSRILEKILKLAKREVKAVVPGSDLTQYLFENVLAEKDKILIFGGEEDKVNSLCELYPGLNIEHINPSMGFINKDDEVQKLISDIKGKDFNYLFLAVGSPRQEVFADKLKQAGVERGVSLCIGASINFLVGVEKRAPKIMQILHLEWLYRMLQDPARLIKRYASNASYLVKIYFCLKK
jgi:exopolysaccharide biosynthesis WecB/TagA/CpsF family protein